MDNNFRETIMASPDPDSIFRLSIFGLIALFLLPAIFTIAAAKRQVAFDLIATAITLNGAWGIQGILIMVALLIFLAIPTWGLLLIVYRNTT